MGMDQPGPLPPDLRQLIERGALPLGPQPQRPIYVEHRLGSVSWCLVEVFNHQGQKFPGIAFDVPMGDGVERYTVAFDLAGLRRFAAKLADALANTGDDEFDEGSPT